jgi:2-phospho-L-lactate guanylyltransferase
LSDNDRFAFAQALAHNALQRLSEQGETLAVADDQSVLTLTRSYGYNAIATGTRGLNEALNFALNVVAREGYSNALIVHSDIPMIGSLRLHLSALIAGRAVLTPDRHGEGTNLLGFPLNAAPSLHYGRGSAHQHLRSLSSLGIDTSTFMSDTLSFDIDSPLDLIEFTRYFEGRIPQEIAALIGHFRPTISTTTSFANES